MRSAAIGLVLSAAAALQPAIARAADSVKVAFLRDINNVALFRAEDAGYFKKNGIDVENVPLNDGPAVASAVVSGAADIGYAAAAVPISARDAGQPVRIFLSNGFEIYPYSPNMIFIVASGRSKVESLQGLKGKTIAVNAMSGGCLLAVRDQLRHVGLADSAVKFLVVPFPQTQAVLRLGEADAACIIEPFFTAIRLDPHIKAVVLAKGMLAGKKSGRGIVNGYFAKSDWLTAHKDLAGRFLISIRKAAYELAKNDSLFHQELIKHYGMKPEFANQVPNSVTPSDMVARPQDYEELIANMQKSRMLKTPLKATDVVETIEPPSAAK